MRRKEFLQSTMYVGLASIVSPCVLLSCQNSNYKLSDNLLGTDFDLTYKNKQKTGAKLYSYIIFEDVSFSFFDTEINTDKVYMSIQNKQKIERISLIVTQEILDNLSKMLVQKLGQSNRIITNDWGKEKKWTFENKKIVTLSNSGINNLNQVVLKTSNSLNYI